MNLTTFFSSKFCEMFYSTMPKWGLKFYFTHNSYVLTISGQALIFILSHTLWGFMMENEFQFKNDIPTHHSHKCQLYIFFILLSNFCIGRCSNDIGNEIHFILHDVGEFCGWILWRWKAIVAFVKTIKCYVLGVNDSI